MYNNWDQPSSLIAHCAFGSRGPWFKYRLGKLFFKDFSKFFDAHSLLFSLFYDIMTFALLGDSYGHPINEHMDILLPI